MRGNDFNRIGNELAFHIRTGASVGAKVRTMLSKRYLGILAREFTLAIGFTTVCLILFAVSGHPVEEWAAAAVVLYVSLWLSKEIFLSLLLFAIKRLLRYGARAMSKAETQLHDIASIQSGPGYRLFIVIAHSMILAVVLGASLVLGIEGMALLDFTPLADYFSWIGWTLLGVGTVLLTLYLAVMWLAFSTLEKMLGGPARSPGGGTPSLYGGLEKGSALAGMMG